MTDRRDKDIARLFATEIVPFGKRAASSGASLLETRWDKDAASYFVRRSRPRMAKGDFETGGCSSPDSVAADLERLWSARGKQPLAKLAPAFARLAKTLRSVEREADDVSSFIYVMY